MLRSFILTFISSLLLILSSCYPLSLLFGLLSIIHIQSCQAAEVIINNFDHHRQQEMIITPSTGIITDDFVKEVYNDNDKNDKLKEMNDEHVKIQNDIIEQKDVKINSEKKIQKKKKTKKTKKERTIGTLRPSDLPEPVIYDDWTPQANQTVTLSSMNSITGLKGNMNISYASGAVPQQKSTSSKSNNKKQTQADVTFSVLPSLVSRNEVHSILELLRNYDKELDDDPDTVDGMPSYEIFVDNIDRDDTKPSIKFRDYTDKEHRMILRQKLQKILLPIIHERITPFIRWRYPNLCSNNNVTTKDNNKDHRLCIACYSLIRRYRYGERVSHAQHHDGHAIVTAVTSLSDYDKNYRGGLYVVSPNAIVTTDANKKKQKKQSNTSKNDEITNNLRYLGLNAGDTAIHTSALLHGVKVYPKHNKPRETERWSWILWFRDSGSIDDDNEYYNSIHDNGTATTSTISTTTIQQESCRNYDNSNEWFKQCAIDGDPICQQLHATKVHTSYEVVDWNMKAANHGAGTAAVKIARAYLKHLQSDLQYNVSLAMEYYQKSITYHNNPEGHYGMAELLIQSITLIEQPNNIHQKNMISNYVQWKKQRFQQAIYHLETAAISGHVFAMFNLGIAHTYGYGIYDNNNNNQPIINTKLASEWFIDCGLPEGYYTASFYYASIGNTRLQQKYIKRSSTLGYNTSWRKDARKHTGSGGIGGIDINIEWPTAHDGRKPPQF